MKATMILSGGMDSATLAYWLKDNDYDELCCISFDYGQRHSKELDSARIIANNLGAEHSVIDISSIKPFLKGSALTDDVDVPHGHYCAPQMALTVVPNRNAIMLSFAWGIACANGSSVLACGVHAGDHHIYPDCRPEFISLMNLALRTGTEGHRRDGLTLIAPFVDITKTDIAGIGDDLKVWRLSREEGSVFG